MKHLVEIAEAFEFVRNGVTIKQIDNSVGIPITRIETIWNATIDCDRFGYADIQDLQLYKNHFLEEGDILMSHINSPKHLGKCAFYKGVPEILIHGMNLLNLRPIKKIIYPKYVYYYFNSDYFKQNLKKISNQSVNQASFSSGKLKKFKIPLIPLSEQKKIAEILDAADKLKQKDQQLIEYYNSLSQSLFLEIFGDPVINPMGWNRGTIRDFVSTVNYGTSSKAQDDGSYPYLRMNNITYEGYMDFSSLKYISLEEKEKEKFVVKKGDILFNRTNSKELVGKTGLYNENSEMVIAGYLIRLRTNSKANPYYIWRYLNSYHGKTVLSHMCKSIVGMANINAQELQNIKLLLPPIELQNKFAKIVDDIETQKQYAQASLKKSTDLFNCLLQKAFKGELI